jgi:DNA modification methylase
MTWHDVRPEARLWTGDALAGLRTLPDASVQCCVTSPPYYALRSYLPQGHEDKALEVGSEETPDAYVARLVDVFREVRRVLRDDGTCWVNLGDSYNSKPMGRQVDPKRKSRDGSYSYDFKRPFFNGLQQKQLLGIPWMVAFALRADGWYLRQDIIWSKKNCMPESIADRCTKSHEYVFLLAKSARYFFDADAIREPVTCFVSDTNKISGEYSSGSGRNDSNPHRSGGFVSKQDMRNKRSVWTLASEPTNDKVKTFHWKRVLAGGAFDGMRRIPSAGCPVHGHQDLQDGVRSVCFVIHSHGIDSCHGQVLLDELFSNSIHLDGSMLVSNSGLTVLSCDQIASEHSNQNHRMVLVGLTKNSCTPCDEKTNYTGDISVGHGYSCVQKSTGVSRIWPDVLSVDVWEKIRCDSVGIACDVPSGCTCGVYHKKTTETSHFAVMPSALADLCIRAGTSERGACAACGSPWRRRLADRDDAGTIDCEGEWRGEAAQSSGRRILARMNAARKAGAAHDAPFQGRATVGWEPSCGCVGTEQVPCTVIDPFTGSGTTGIVALRQDRRFVGCELNAEYAKMAARRIAAVEIQLALL